MYVRRTSRGPSPVLVFLAGAAVAALIGLGLALYIFILPGSATAPAYTGNGIWLGVTWAKDPYPEDTIRLLGEHLRDHHIRDVYVYVSYLRVDDTTWNETYDYAREFARVIKAAAPGLRLFSWIGIPVNAEDGTYRLDSEAVQARVGQFAERTITQFGFDGVHLNVESIPDGNQDFLNLLDSVREVVGPDVPLSVTVPPDWNPGLVDIPAGPLTEPGFIWAQAYKRAVGERVDQIALMAYNSGLEAATDYETWMAYQVETYIEALAGLPGAVKLVVGVPTYAQALPGHDEKVEHIRAALNGVHVALERIEDGPRARLAGVALYAFWDTDAIEWALYRELWLRAR